MSTLLEEAIAKGTMLPAATQEKIGDEMITHVEKVHRLRAEIDKGIRSLERGEGRELDIEDFIQQAHARHGTA